MNAAAVKSLVPGLAVSIVVALISGLVGRFEEMLVGRAWLEPLVVAILLGAFVGNLMRLDSRFAPGIKFGAKEVLELAVALLGLSLSAQALRTLGIPLLVSIPILVLLSLACGYGISRRLGLGRKLSLLIATGNSICGNSAIASVAPIIGAKREEIAASISLTAIVGVAVVILLPLFGVAASLDHTAYGVFTGLTVYAVPQVLAAAAPYGQQAIVLATLVKLARVIMLGPLTFIVSIGARYLLAPGEAAGEHGRTPLVPWFVIAFALLAIARAASIVPPYAISALAAASSMLTLVAMAALGLGVDARVLRAVGPRVAMSTTFSLIAVAALALTLVSILRL